MLRYADDLGIAADERLRANVKRMFQLAGLLSLMAERTQVRGPIDNENRWMKSRSWTIRVPTGFVVLRFLGVLVSVKEINGQFTGKLERSHARIIPTPPRHGAQCKGAMAQSALSQSLQ